jgi:hypothetical protein
MDEWDDIFADMPSGKHVSKKQCRIDRRCAKLTKQMKKSGLLTGYTELYHDYVDHRDGEYVYVSHDSVDIGIGHQYFELGAEPMGSKHKLIYRHFRKNARESARGK